MKSTRIKPIVHRRAAATLLLVFAIGLISRDVAATDDPLGCQLAQGMNSYDAGLGIASALTITATRARKGGNGAAASRWQRAADCANSEPKYAGKAYKAACVAGNGEYQPVMTALLSALAEQCSE